MDQSFLNRFLKITPFFCAVMVIGIHSYIKTGEEITAGGVVQSVLCHGFFTAAVPIFFMISGYLFYRNADSFSVVLKKQKKRVLTYFVPFISWSLLYYIAYFVMNKAGTGKTAVDTSVSGVIKGVLFYRYLFPFWFMFALIVYTLLADVIYLILKNRAASIAVLAVCAAAGAFAVSFKINIDTNTARTIFSPGFFMYYFTGAFAAVQKEKFLRLCETFRKMSFPLVISLLFVSGVLEGLNYDYFKIFNKRILVPFVAFFTFVLFDKLSVVLYEKNFSFDKFSTFAMYGAHPMIGMLLSIPLSWFSLPLLPKYFISFLLCTALSVAVSFVIKKIKPLKFILCGNRK
ncbi:MAG: acyltransferase [Clostridia bacterium]|nr:acyltransferase [Clostridia bacterium]